MRSMNFAAAASLGCITENPKAVTPKVFIGIPIEAFGKDKLLAPLGLMSCGELSRRDKRKANLKGGEI